MATVAGCLSLLLGGCSAALPECAPNLTREGLLQELLFPQGTSRTPEFDDYTPGSYHINKSDLVEAVRSRRVKSPGIGGVLILGPRGPLWQYDVLLFMSREKDVGVHFLSMPHARITWKAAGAISPAAYAALLAKLSTLPEVQLGSPPRSAASQDDHEWSYGVLGAFWSPSEILLHSTWTWSKEPSGGSSIDQIVGDLVDGLQTTYSVDLPEGEDLYTCPR